MKKYFILIISALLLSLSANADERPITFDRLPVQARTFINNHYLASEVTHVLRDESVIRPEYTVYIAHGVSVEFDYNGSLEKISSKETPIPADVIPAQIQDYVARHYPDATFVEYEVDHKHYEVKLSNRVELNFNRKFHLIEVDY
jgi:hypothetical protein